MVDANEPMDAAPQAADVVEPTGQAPVETPAPENPAPEAEPMKAQAQPERTVPYSALREERGRRQELQRKIAEYEARMRSIPQREGDMSPEEVMQHPFVQDLLIKQAERDLKDHTRELLDQHPGIPDSVRKAILRNPRGFVQPTTTDVENAKLDIQEYIEALEDGTALPPTSKAFPVAPTAAPATQTSGSPAEIAKILEKPVEDMTDEEIRVVDQYRKNQPKR